MSTVQKVCVLDALGRADFERLHARARKKSRYEGADSVVFCVFDLLYLRGRDIRALPIEARKEQLQTLLGFGNRPSMLYVQSLVDQADWLYQQATTLNLEGVVCKRAGSTYQAGVRSPDWVKVKLPGVHLHGAFKRDPRLRL